MTLDPIAKLLSSATSEAKIYELAFYLSGAPQSLEDVLDALRHAYELGRVDGTLGIKLPEAIDG